MPNYKKIGSGRTADVYALDEDKVLKLFHSSVSEQTVQKEYKIAKTLSNLDIPVPEVYERMEKDNRKGIVYAYVKGPVMTEVIAQKPWRVRKAARMLARLHLRIHDHSVSSIPRFKASLRQSMDHAGLESHHKKALVRTLDQLEADSVLCHGDFHPDNVIWGSKAFHVIDWLDASSGHPLLDVARTKMLLEYSALPDNLSWFKRRIITMIRRTFLRTYLNTYFKKSTLDYAFLSTIEPIVWSARQSESIPEAEKRVIRRALMKHMESL